MKRQEAGDDEGVRDTDPNRDMQHAAASSTPSRPKASRLKRWLVRPIAVVLLVFVAPALATAAWWSTVDRPGSWRQADWGATDLLAEPAAAPEAAIHVLAARTGGLKGAFATHSWIVTKESGADRYNRYDKVGWGRPVRQNAYPPAARWYSNEPVIIGSITGAQAEALIPKIEAAIAAYPYNGYTEENGYRIYPGPNSNTFVAHVLREVPELGMVLPPNAVGRDYLSEGRFVAIADDWLDVTASLYGLVGVSAGLRSGFEVHFMGLVAGIDVRRVGVKVPAFGLVSLY
jgi:hypothetical protein